MLKPIFFAGAALLALPAAAQSTPAPVDTTPPASEADTMTADPGTAAPATNSTDPTTDESAQPDSSQTAASASQISQIIDKDFPTYDADANGELSQSEFGSWMTALKASTEPSFDATSAEAQTWLGKAFASADADKSDTVSKVELTGFLTRGAG